MQVTRRLISGLLTFLPGGRFLTERRTGSAGSAPYCYWVWLHHILIARENRLLGSHPTAVAELGPGDSLGAGLTAILTGARQYDAFDVIEYANVPDTLRILDQLVELLRRHAPVESDADGAPLFNRPHFPEDLLPEDRLSALLAPARLDAVRAAVRALGKEHCGIRIGYEPRWLETGSSPEIAPELLFSQAVLEHVDDLASAYQAMARWLPRGAVISHEIDFRSHGFAPTWNGHWTYSDKLWRLIRGRRRYAINREPLSRHLNLMRSSGFRVVDVRRLTNESQVSRRDLVGRFRSMSGDDLTTEIALVQAVREAGRLAGADDEPADPR